MKKTLLALALGLFGAQSASAVDLLTAYQKALAYDSDLAAARAAYEAQTAGSRQALSPLLPQLNAFGEGSHTDRDTNYNADDSFSTVRYGLRLTQPLFRADVYYDYRASEKNELRAQAEYWLAQQSLMLDVSESYFNVLRAQDALTTARSTEAALKRQWEQAKERYDVGLIAITEVLEARAAYDDSKSRRITAANQVAVARESLARLTGQYHEDLDKLERDFPIASPEPASLGQWEQTALKENLSIRAAQFQLDASDSQLDSAEADHYPTLNLTASHTRTDVSGQASMGAVPNDYENQDSVIALNLNVPLYSGGGTQAGVRRASAQREQAQQSLLTAQRNVRVNTRSLYRTIINNIETVQAQKQTIVSRRSALEATRAGYRVGTRNIVEVLDAEQAYYVALRDYANARYDYVINSLRLKQAAGTLKADDIIELDQWLSNNAPGIEAMAAEVQEQVDPVEPQSP